MLCRLHQPVIAAVNGPAIGCGLCLALAAAIRVVSTTSYFWVAGINNRLTASELRLNFIHCPVTLDLRVRSRSCWPVAVLPPRKVERIGLVSCQVLDEQRLNAC